MINVQPKDIGNALKDALTDAINIEPGDRFEWETFLGHHSPQFWEKAVLTIDGSVGSTSEAQQARLVLNLIIGTLYHSQQKSLPEVSAKDLRGMESSDTESIAKQMRKVYSGWGTTYEDMMYDHPLGHELEFIVNTIAKVILSKG